MFRRTLSIPLDLSSATLVSRETLWHSSCLDCHMGFPFRVRVGRCLSDLLLLQDAESCYLAHSLLKFYLDTVFENYYSKIAKLRILREFSILVNNFHAILSKLQPSVSRSRREPRGNGGLENPPLPHPVLASTPNTESWVSWKRGYRFRSLSALIRELSHARCSTSPGFSFVICEMGMTFLL